MDSLGGSLMAGAQAIGDYLVACLASLCEKIQGAVMAGCEKLGNGIRSMNPSNLLPNKPSAPSKSTPSQGMAKKPNAGPSQGKSRSMDRPSMPSKVKDQVASLRQNGGLSLGNNSPSFGLSFAGDFDGPATGFGAPVPNCAHYSVASGRMR